MFQFMWQNPLCYNIMDIAQEVANAIIQHKGFCQTLTVDLLDGCISIYYAREFYYAVIYGSKEKHDWEMCLVVSGF